MKDMRTHKKSGIEYERRLVGKTYKLVENRMGLEHCFMRMRDLLTGYFWCPKCDEGFTFTIQKMIHRKTFTVRCYDCGRIVGFFCPCV